MLSSDLTPPVPARDHPDAAARAIAILHGAFARDPFARWLFPERAAYDRHFPALARIFGAPGFRDGTLGLSAAAAALWLRPGSEADETALAALIEGALPRHRQGAVLAAFDEMGRHLPDRSFWYLQMMGTLPGHRGRGHGAALIAPVLAECDRTGTPACLEASTPRSRALYARLGFRPTAVIPLPGGPEITTMLRPPA